MKHSKRKKFFKLAKTPSTWTVYDQIEEFLKKQKEEDTMLIKPPKEVKSLSSHYNKITFRRSYL